ENIVVGTISRSPEDRGLMVWGNKPTDDGNLVLTSCEKKTLINLHPNAETFVRPYFGAAEFIRGLERYCLWIEDSNRADAERIPLIRERVRLVADFRAMSKAADTRPAALFPHRFR